MIISGGENISSIEVEQVITNIRRCSRRGGRLPDDKWGERPKAYVALKPGQTATAQDIIGFCRSRIARFKAPAAVEIMDQLPKTATGKVQKFVLRDKEWAGHDKRVGYRGDQPDPPPRRSTSRTGTTSWRPTSPERSARHRRSPVSLIDAGVPGSPRTGS